MEKIGYLRRSGRWTRRRKKKKRRRRERTRSRRRRRKKRRTRGRQFDGRREVVRETAY